MNTDNLNGSARYFNLLSGCILLVCLVSWIYVSCFTTDVISPFALLFSLGVAASSYALSMLSYLKELDKSSDTYKLQAKSFKYEAFANALIAFNFFVNAAEDYFISIEQPIAALTPFANFLLLGSMIWTLYYLFIIRKRLMLK